MKLARQNILVISSISKILKILFEQSQSFYFLFFYFEIHFYIIT